jgi:hypothetical protein
MNLSENIAVANRFRGRRVPMTLTEANATVPQRATALFGVSVVKRLAASREAEKTEEKPAQKNPNLLSA